MCVYATYFTRNRKNTQNIQISRHLNNDILNNNQRYI